MSPDVTLAVCVAVAAVSLIALVLFKVGPAWLDRGIDRLLGEITVDTATPAVTE